MRTYKMVLLNQEMHLSRKKDIADAEQLLNEYAAQGWILQQVVSPNDGLGSMIAVMYKEPF